MICFLVFVVLFRDIDVFIVFCIFLKKEDILVFWKEKICNLIFDICIWNYIIYMYVYIFLLLVELRFFLFIIGDVVYKIIIICLL